MEMKFSEALLSEDRLQLKLNEIAAQSWFQVFLSRWMEYSLPFLVPAGAAVITFVTVPVLLYFKCCCCCKSGKCLSSTTCAKNQKTNLSNLEERVSKLETFFEFFIQDRYHHISENDVKQKIVNRKTDKEKWSNCVVAMCVIILILQSKRICPVVVKCVVHKYSIKVFYFKTPLVYVSKI